MLINPAAFTAPAQVTRLQRALDTYDERKCDALISCFVAHSTWHVPTLVRLRASELAALPEYQNSPCLRYMPAENVRRWRKVTSRFRRLPQAMRNTYECAYSKQLQLTKKLMDAGVRMMTGTDGGWLSGPGLTLHEEFKELARAGLSPLQILRMSTTNAAEYLGQTQHMGAIQPGHEANMVVVDANPLERVEHLCRITGVMRTGLFYSRQELDQLRERVAAGRGFLR
jgi:imidazolonepropionase-like amidohydrolase